VCKGEVVASSCAGVRRNSLECARDGTLWAHVQHLSTRGPASSTHRSG
jgi:hypothetical protein